MKAFIKTLLGYESLSRNGQFGNSGVLGHVKSYYGCVEAQGRGSLYCHMLVWIEGSLNPDELKENILTDLDFRTRIITYLENIISTSVRLCYMCSFCRI